MYDSNVFAVITAHDTRNLASSALRLPENSKWFRPATGGVADRPSLGSREATPATDVSTSVVSGGGGGGGNDSDTESEGEDDWADGAADCLVVTFDEPLKNPENGLQLGSSPLTSDILLGHRGTRGVSARQYNITVDDDLRIWLHDYHSRHGTAVSLGGQNGAEVRRKETWLLAHREGPLLPEIAIYSGKLAVKFEFPNHHHGMDPAYLASLRAFSGPGAGHRQGTPPVEGLALDSGQTTQAPTGTATPASGLLYYNVKSIGKGAFGQVYSALRGRDGRLVAAKTFKPPPNKRKRGQDGPAWLAGIRKEFGIMNDHPHDNVMEVFEFRESPTPTIYMAYYPDGNMADAAIADEDDYVTAFGQVLDGLGHLHANGIAHRDLKPENLLVQKSPLFKVVIADFGLSKVATETTVLMTFCGTLKYLAPEVFPGSGLDYDLSVDVWSLGVIVLEWLYDVPKPKKAPEPARAGARVTPGQWQWWASDWHGQVLGQLDDQEEDDQVVGLLRGMLVVDPAQRWGAARCLEAGCGEGLWERRGQDGLVVCASAAAVGGRGGMETPRASSPRREREPQDSTDSDATILLERLRRSAAPSALSRSALELVEVGGDHPS